MTTFSVFKMLHLTMLSKPACDRALYQAIKKNKVASIIEIGVGNLKRTENMIRIAKQFSDGQPVRYTGIDRFEASGLENPVRLKDAHQQLKKHQIRLQLVPGEAYSSLTRIANSHLRTDLIVFSGDYVDASIEDCWFYFPRMLHANSLFFMQTQGDNTAVFEPLSRLEIERKTQNTNVKTARAA